MRLRGPLIAVAALAILSVSVVGCVVLRPSSPDWPDELWAGYRRGTDGLALAVRTTPRGEDVRRYDVTGSHTAVPIGEPRPLPDDAIDVELVDSDRLAGSRRLANVLGVGPVTRWYDRAEDRDSVERDGLLWSLYRRRQ